MTPQTIVALLGEGAAQPSTIRTLSTTAGCHDSAPRVSALANVAPTMAQPKLIALRRCLFAGLTALRATERCQVQEAQAGAIVELPGDDPAAWSSRVRAERQHEDGVKARAAAEVAVVRYRQLKAEADRA